MADIITNNVGTFYKKEFGTLEKLFKDEPSIIYQLLETGFEIQDSRVLVKDKDVHDDLVELYKELKGENPSISSLDKYELIIKLKLPKK
jgi:hypothetical protein|tara:strand:- start:498 stop:764 length:267 start_codon:yes stop_codon:yes gene_type:complete